MPVWFKRQLQQAYLQKDRYQIKLLNQCWFFYKENTAPKGSAYDGCNIVRAILSF